MRINFLFKLGIFEIDITSIISFIIGIFLGAIIVCGVYVVAVLSSLRNKKFIVKVETDDVQTEEIKQMILDAQVSYKNKELRAENSRIGFCTELCKKLAIDIASKFYPNSKYPLLELSIDELMMLIIYIEGRLEEIFNRRGLRLFKRVNVATIFNITSKTNQVMDSKAYHVTKEVGGAIGTIKKVINVVNPAWWIRKLVIDNTFNVITDKLCLVTLAIVGEEIYKIYSKTVFNEEKVIDTNVDQLLSQIDKKLIEASDDVKNNTNEDELYMPKSKENKKLMVRAFKFKECNFVERNLYCNSKFKEYNTNETNSFKSFNDKYMKDGD